MHILNHKPPIKNEDTNKNDTVYAHITSALYDIEEHEKQLKSIMQKSLKSSRSNYQFKAMVNVIMVIIGTTLIVNPIAFFWLENTNMITNDSGNNNSDMFNYFLGGMGIVTLVSSFFTNPQNRMSVAIGDLIQMHLICNMYTLQFHGIAGKYKERSKKALMGQEICSIKDIEKINTSLYDLTSKSLELIDKYIEKKARKDIIHNASLSSDNKGNLIARKEEKIEEKIPFNN